MHTNSYFKKIVAIFLLVTLAFGVVACSHEEASTNSTDTTASSTAPDNTTTSEIAPTSTEAEPQIPKNGYVVAIDAGHQAKANTGKEPLGPGSDVMKTKVSAGTTGISTGKPEYELTLEVALKLQTELESRGYTVVMIRTSNDVDISNAERAEIANNANADAFLRLHADGYDDSSVNGATAIYMSKNNPFNASLYDQSKALATAVLNGLTASAGCKKRALQENDSMTGINWCQVPVTIVEMGFMTNPEEDQLLSTEEYQDKIVIGIANGLDTYFNIN